MATRPPPQPSQRVGTTARGLRRWDAEEKDRKALARSPTFMPKFTSRLGKVTTLPRVNPEFSELQAGAMATERLANVGA